MSATTEHILENEMRNCIRCGHLLYNSAFRPHSQNGNLRNICNECNVNRVNHWQHINREQTRINQRRYNKTKNGRAFTLYNAAKSRASKKNEHFQLDIQDVHNALKNGICEKTGVKFDLKTYDQISQSPYAPSIDKINPKGIYEKSNVQYVCWWYNCAKHEWGENVLIHMCEKVIEFNRI